MPLLLAWVVFPVLFLLVAGGLGLLVWRASGETLPRLLILPTGAMCAIVLSTFGTWQDWTAAAAGPALLLSALCGYLSVPGVIRRGLTSAADVTAAAGGAFVAFGASTVLSGKPVFTGYTQIVDIGHQFDFAAYLARHGRIDPNATSSSLEVVHKLLDVGYPSGSQALLGVIARSMSVDIEWIYQPFVAVLAALLVVPIVSLLQPTDASMRARAACAFIAAQPSLLVGYGQMGGVKEVAGALAVMLCAALVPSFLAHGARARAAIPFAIALAGGYAVLGPTLLPWLGMVALGALLAARRLTGWTGSLRLGVVTATACAALSVPMLAAASKVSGATQTIKSSTDIGNLAAPVDKVAAVGIWLTPDHRFPLHRFHSLSVAADLLVLAFALLGSLWAARRRDVSLVNLAVAGVVSFIVMMRLVGPWVQLKAFVITGPIVLTLAMAGALAFGGRSARRFMTYSFVAAVAVFVLWADALRYHDATLAPYGRFDELAEIGHRFAGTGPALAPDFEEQAEYLLRQEHGVSSVNPPKGDFELRPEVAARPVAGPRFTIDLDELAPAFLQRFRLLVVDRDPRRSRPPSNYALAFRGRFYDVWRRVGTAPLVHRPLSGTGAAPDQVACRSAAGSARRHGLKFLAATAPTVVVGDPTSGQISGNWVAPPGTQTLTVRGPGRSTFGVNTPVGGQWSVYLLSNAVRAATVTIDNRVVGRVSHSISYPGIVSAVGRVTLSRGAHVVSIARPGGSLAPGNGDGTGRQLGPLLLSRDDGGQIRSGPAALRACAGPVDWVEARR